MAFNGVRSSWDIVRNCVFSDDACSSRAFAAQQLSSLRELRSGLGDLELQRSGRFLELYSRAFSSVSRRS